VTRRDVSPPRGDGGPVGVLALQGSFPLHLEALERAGTAGREVRKPCDLEGLRGLIVPGGESTVQSLLLSKYELFEPIRELGREGLPIFGTCAGAILLGRGEPRPPRWGLVDVEVIRNAYGRQVDSFSADVEVEGFDSPFHATFIRAPKLRLPERSTGIEVLARQGAEAVLVRSGAFLLATFHPELTEDLRIHRMFLGMCGLEG
jgi:5'-phosphate synthase pdxT subunit